MHRLIVTIDRRVGLPLSRGERLWGRFLFCGDEKLGCMVDGELLQRELMKIVFSMRPVMGGLLCVAVMALYRKYSLRS